jgi:hypothetical protein
MKIVYVAHQLSGDREANRAKAAEWVGWLAQHCDIAPVADWIILTGQWHESMRERGLAIDLRLVEECDEVWLVGERVSDGMAIEAHHATRIGIQVRDFTKMDRVDILACVGVQP